MVNKITKQFSDYVNSLPIGKPEQEKLASPELYEAHSFYLDLIPFFTENGKVEIDIIAESLEGLGFASYLYFRALLVYDGITDSSLLPMEKKVHLYAFFSFFERSSAELGRLYDNNNYFWKHFDTCKQQYFNATFLEKAWAVKRPVISEEMFKDLAVGKSAVCNAMVYALNELMPNYLDSSRCLDCLHHLHVGFQYLDDVDDFKKDIIEQQWTYAQSLVVEALQEQGRDPLSISDESKYRYFFLSGIATDLLRRAIDQFRLAKTIAMAARLNKLVAFIENKEERCANQITEISLLIEKTKHKAKRSNVVVATDIWSAISNSLCFIQGSLHEDGYWRDFLTSAGFGRDWITAYVALQLSDIPGNEELISKISAQLLSETSAAYNENIIADADSMNFLIWLLKNKAKSVLPLKHWYSFMHIDGGWATYNNETLLRKKLELDSHTSVAGWIMPHNCVSAVAACVLASIDEGLCEVTLEYLIRQQKEEGFISSYWWTSPIYATSFGLIALSETQKHMEAALKMANWLRIMQSPDGSWHDPAAKAPCALYTALAMKALLCFDSVGYEKCIQKGKEWLLGNQVSDGSWLTNRVLLLPATDVTHLETVENWRKSSFGVNVMIDDHNRLFTTATALNTLYLYKQKYSLAHAS